MTSGSRLASTAIVVAALLSGRPAVAQAPRATPQEIETARTLFREGKGLRAEGDLRGALEKLKAAHALAGTPVTGLELARTEVMLGQMVEARDVVLAIGRAPVAPEEGAHSAEARTEAAKLADDLRARIPTLILKVDGAAQSRGVHVVIDGVAIPDVASNEPQKVDPGERHEVVVSVDDGRSARVDVELREGETRVVEVALPPLPEPALLAPEAASPPQGPPPEPPPPEPPRPASAATSHLLINVGFGTAVVGVTVGLLSGLSALNKKGELGTDCNPQKQCDVASGGTGDLNSARTWAAVSTASFALSAVGVVVGVVGLLSRPKPSRSTAGVHVVPWISGTAAGVHGTF